MRINALKRYEVDLAALIRSVEEWETELKKATESSEKLAKITEERDAKYDELKELELRAQQLGRRITAATEQKQRQAKQAESKKDSLQKRIAELQETHELLMAQRQDVDEEHSKRQRAIALKEREVCSPACSLTRSKSSQILDLVKAAETDIAQGEAAYRELKAEVC